MAEPFLSELRVFSFGFPPQGWAACNGQLLPINQNQALFSLLGTTYGGNGQTNFGLPDLRGRVPIHEGAGHTLGERAGEQAHTLSQAEIPTHTHTLSAITSGLGATAVPTNNALGPALNAYAPGSAGNLTSMSPSSIANIGGSQAHLNMQPFLVLNICIALLGIFPSQT